MEKGKTVFEMENGKPVQCPTCGAALHKTETGLWCYFGCYGSEYEVWVALGRPERGEGWDFGSRS